MLVSNFGQDTVMVEPFSEIGMIGQVIAIQPVMDRSSGSPVDPVRLPEHLQHTMEPVGPNTPGVCGSVSGSRICFDGAH